MFTYMDRIEKDKVSEPACEREQESVRERVWEGE